MRFILLKEGGKEKAVFLLHGSTQRYYTESHPLFLLFKDTGVSVYSVELPGHGKSVFTRKMEPTEIIDVFREGFLRFIDEIGVKEVCVIGYSLGGLLGLKLLELNDERINCVVGIATGLVIDEEDAQRIQLYFTPQTYDALHYTRGMVKLHGEQGWRLLIESLHDLFFVGSPILLDKNKVLSSEGKALLLLGSEDEAFSSENTKRVVKDYGFVELNVLPGIGHFEYFNTGFDMVRERILRFLVANRFL